MSSEPGLPSATAHGLLAASAAALAHAATVDEGLSELLELGARAVGAERAAVFSRDPERAELTLLAWIGPGEAPAPEEATMAAAFAGEPTVGRPTTIDGTDGTGADLPLVVARSGIDLRLGAVSLAWAGRRSLSDGDVALLAAIADLLAVALDRGRLATLAESRAERAGQLALMDGLTGLANARTLDRILELEVARASRQGGEVAVAVFDIDAFGELNERAGREAGDHALREVAAAVAGSVRLVDSVARTGADEFVVVAPGSAGRAVAHRILDAVGSLPARGVEVSVSAGVARFPADGASPRELLEVARHALGAAREAGGGRIAGGDGVEPAA